MSKFVKSIGMMMLALIMGLGISQVAHAQTGYSTITMYAPEASATAWVSVQWQDALGVWHDVEGWQGSLDLMEDDGVPFKQWAVMPDNYGQGPFRWVIYAEAGGAVWAVSESFYLPGADGADFSLFLTQQAASAQDETAVADATASAAPADEATLTAESFTIGFAPADSSRITAYIPDAPAAAWISVQWSDGFGVWHDVEGWQGSLDLTENDSVPFKQWAVMSDNYGQGPFRLVIYAEAGGAVWGVGPSFNLPGTDGQDFTMILSR